MPYHIKKQSKLGSAVPTGGAEYYTGENNWSNEYDKRKVYENKADADSQKATSVSRTIGGATYTYQPDWWKNSEVVSE